MEIKVQWQPWYGGLAVLMRDKRPDGWYVVPPGCLAVEKQGPTAEFKPTFVMDSSEAQMLLDELYQCGFRPSTDLRPDGQLAATEKHLEDMRKIAFKYIEK